MTEDEITDVVVHESFGLVQHDQMQALAHTEKLVQYMAKQCTGPQFISNIQGRKYPKVEWWTTVGMTLGLLPVEVSSERIDFDGGYKYLAVVEVRRDEKLVTRASAICSTEERSWGNRDEYAIKSMAGTRATGKAYRIGLSALAVMAGLEPTPADEIPPQGFSNAPRADAQPSPHGKCAEHGIDFFQAPNMRSAAHKYPHPTTGEVLWCNKPDAPAPEQEVQDDVRAEWNAAMQAVTEALDTITDDQPARDELVKARIGTKRPRELTPEELYALAEQLSDEDTED